jgi:hypothetical protein
MLHCIRYGLTIAPIFLLAGCWQKIEYTGKSTSAAKAPASPAVATDGSTEIKPANAPAPINAQPGVRVAENPIATPRPEFQPPAATPIPTAPTANAKSDDDRYAIPAKDHGSSSAKLSADDTQPPVAPEQQSPKRHTDASPVSATVDVAPRTVSPKIRHAVWILGSRLSLAALAHDRGMAANSIPTWLDEAHSACKVLGTSVPELPEPAAPSDTALASRQVIDYLLVQGQRIGRDLSQRYGPEQASLFEVALKSNILLLLYSPGSNAATSISAAISRAAPKAGLPAELWQPVVDRVNKQSSLDDVRASVRQMHNDVDQYLANAAEPPGR